jgi:hypothetical protein
MLVSNFSLGFNPPLTGTRPTSKYEVRWTRGYSLHITNLASKKIQFEIETRITYTYFGGISGEPIPVSLNKLLWGTWHHDVNGYYSVGTRDIDHNAADIWHLQPWMWDDRFWTPYVDGYIILRVPVVRSPRDPQQVVAQSTDPVPVLLSAWHQDDRVQVVTDTDLQTSSQCDVPISTGKAYNEIVPETEPVTHPSYIGDIAHVREEIKTINAMRYRVRGNLDPYRMG